MHKYPLTGDAEKAAQAHMESKEVSQDLDRIQAFEPNELELEVLEAAAQPGATTFFVEGEIRAEFLKILLLGLRDDWPITACGVDITGAPGVLITGNLELAGARARSGDPLPPLSVNYCSFDGAVKLSGAQLTSLTLQSCSNVSVDAENAEVAQNVVLNGARINRLDFAGANIGGYFAAQNAVVPSTADGAFQLDNCKVDGNLILNGLRARKCIVSLDHANISGALSAVGMRIIKGNDVAFSAENARIGGGADFGHSRIFGGLNCRNIKSEAPFLLYQMSVRNSESHAFILEFGKIDSVVALTGARFRGGVILSECRVDGPIWANNVTIQNANGAALSLHSAVARNVELRSAKFHGSVSAPNIEIAELSLSGARINSGAGPTALELDSAIIAHDVEMRSANENGHALEAAAFVGAVNMQNASVGGSVRLSGVRFESAADGGDCLILRRARIRGALEIHDIQEPANGRFDLSGADIDILEDDPETAWPRNGLANFDGLTYRTIKLPADQGKGKELAESRIVWLKRQYEHGAPKHGQFRPQPFEQLARVLRNQGHDYAATKIAVEKRELQRKYADRGFARLVHTVLKWTSDYGYSPARALACFAVWVGIGAGFVKHALVNDLYERASTDSPEALHIEPFAYAFDLSTPIIDFGQASAYRLKPACHEIERFVTCNGREVLELGYSVIGFVIFSILVLTFSGVLRREGG